MSNSGLVSIIIPTYNRAHLLGETLNSVLAQTYPNWECIVVDDDSIDDTENMVQAYAAQDHRIHYHKRPEYKFKGAPGCRNFGKKIARGEFLIFFDSDDLMLKTKLEDHIKILRKHGVDYSISKFDNFNEVGQFPELAYDTNQEGFVDIGEYLMMNTFWGTIDVVFKAEPIKNRFFDEELKSGQEYNFFCGLLTESNLRGYFFNQTTSLRRLHERTIQSDQKKNRYTYALNKFQIFWRTYQLVKFSGNNRYICFLLKRAQSYCYELAAQSKLHKSFYRLTYEVKRNSGLMKSVAFFLGIFCTYNFGKGFFLIKKSFPHEINQ